MDGGYAQGVAPGKPRVLVLGGTGLVGSRFVGLTADRFDVQAPPHARLDVLDDAGLNAYLDQTPADAVVNLVACADVDRSEAERGDRDGSVYRVNTTLPGRLAELCGRRGVYLLHVSTDYVFDGTKDDGPYTEADPPRPLSWYAQTKHEGEQEVLASGASASVVRIEMPYSARWHRKLDFPRLCVTRLRAGTEVLGVIDQRITPVFLDDCVEALARVVEQRAQGLLHVAAADWTTPFDLAQAVAAALRLDASLIRREQFERFATFRPAPRPRHSWLAIEKFEREVGRGVLRGVQESVRAWAAQLGGRRQAPAAEPR